MTEKEMAELKGRFDSHEEHCRERQDVLSLRFDGLEGRFSRLEKLAYAFCGVIGTFVAYMEFLK